MYYDVGDIENALAQIRECLRLNPDHKLCFPFYKRIKTLAKQREALKKTVEAKKWMECIAKAQEILKLEPDVDNVQLDVFRYTCKCNNKVFAGIMEYFVLFRSMWKNDGNLPFKR
jgi:DnaJ family protein C protein 3